MKKIFTILILLTLITLAGREGKSAKKAMLFSALVPGSGEAYLGNYTKAGIFFTTELLTIAAAVRLDQEVGWAEKSYERLALEKAGVPSGSDKVTYQRIQNYISSNDYNHQLEHDAWAYYVLLSNDIDGYYAYLDKYSISEGAEWDWVNNKSWQEYRNIRRQRQDLETFGNLAVAAIVLNHLVSFIDTALTGAAIKRKNRTQGKVYIEPNIIKQGMSIGYAIKF